MSIFDRLYGSTKEEIFAREVAKNMDEVKLSVGGATGVVQKHHETLKDFGYKLDDHDWDDGISTYKRESDAEPTHFVTIHNNGKWEHKNTQGRNSKNLFNHLYRTHGNPDIYPVKSKPGPGETIFDKEK